MGVITFLKQTAASMPTPSAGKAGITIDSTSKQLCLKNEDGTTVLIPGIPGTNAPGGIWSLTTTPAAITTTETVVGTSPLIVASTWLVGTTLHTVAFGAITAGTTASIQGRTRIGTAGTIADTQVCASGAVGSVSAGTGFMYESFVTLRTTGSGGTAVGNCILTVASATAAIGISQQSATIAVNTTVNNFIDLTFIGAGTTPSISVYNAFAEVAKS